MRVIIGILAFVLCTSSNAFSQKHRYSFSDKYEVSKSTKLNVYTTDGFIEVKPTTGNYIEVYYIVEKGKNFLKISREKMDVNYILELEQTDGLLNISLRRRNENKFEVERDRYNVSCEIYVPDSTACSLTSTNGNISIRDLKRDQKCVTIDGTIKISNILGSVDASTSVGNIKIENIHGNVSVSTNKGDIKMENISGEVSAVNTEGDIRFKDCSGSLSGKTTLGFVRGNMTELSGKLKLSSRNGNVNVEIPKAIGIDLKMKGIELHMPDAVQPIELTKNQIFGSANGGGIPVELLSTSGIATLTFK